jgi:hypothetical protein
VSSCEVWWFGTVVDMFCGVDVFCGVVCFGVFGGSRAYMCVYCDAVCEVCWLCFWVCLGILFGGPVWAPFRPLVYPFTWANIWAQILAQITTEIPPIWSRYLGAVFGTVYWAQILQYLVPNIVIFGANTWAPILAPNIGLNIKFASMSPCGGAISKNNRPTSGRWRIGLLGGVFLGLFVVSCFVVSVLLVF